MHRLHTTIILLFLTSTLFASANTSNSHNSELITIVKQQLSLAKKVSTDYVAFQADLTDAKKKAKMKSSISNFNTNHLKLIGHKANTKLIKKKLTKVDEIWRIAHKLSETKRHSKMLKTAMNDISGKLKELRKLYKKTHN